MKPSAALTVLSATLVFGQEQTCTQEMIASDDCAAVIDANACYNEFRWNARTLQCIDGVDDADRKRKTVYRRAWPRWLAPAIAIPLEIAWITIGFTQGFITKAASITGLVALLVLIFFTLIDPETTIPSRRTMPDGTTVNVRRPLFGLRRDETPLGLTGGYEVRIDGYRYEPAYIRI
ncbi:hypothetical protein GGS20DRAFT_581420 [Poronia punctata]|nr:hypothetical protein GGS20DRAFT_581420 [Poronia punctata]